MNLLMYGYYVNKLSQRTIPKFHLNFWCGIFVGAHSFRRVSIRSKLCGNCTFPQNFHTRNLGEITVFYAAFAISQTFSTSGKLNSYTSRL